MKYTAVALAGLMVVTAACGSSDDASSDVTVTLADAPEPVAEEPAAESAEIAADEPVEEAADEAVAEEAGDSTVSETAASSELTTFTAEVWADNWFALHVNGDHVGEDSVSILTERSFNAETITFEATLPLTVAVEAKDFKETDSGIEYIGEGNQQMGDGGFILQITNDATGEVITSTSGEWLALPIHRAPLNTECERDADPDATCEFEIIDAPADWTSVSFDDSAWSTATVWSEADVSPKDGYDEISWDASAQLIWGTDLEVDNTVLLRTTAG